MAGFFISIVCAVVSLICFALGNFVAGGLFCVSAFVSFSLYKNSAPRTVVNTDVHQKLVRHSTQQEPRNPSPESVDRNHVWKPDIGRLVIRQIFSSEGHVAILQYAHSHEASGTCYTTIAMMRNLSGELFISAYAELHSGVNFTTDNGTVSLQYASDNHIATLLASWGDADAVATWLDALSHEAKHSLLQSAEIGRIAEIARHRVLLLALSETDY